MLTIKDFYTVNPMLFDGIQMPVIGAKELPPVQTELDKEAWVQNLLMQVGTLGSYYCDDVELAAAIASWSKLNQNRWARMADTARYDFSPVENYDRYEESSDSDIAQITGKSTSKGGSQDDDNVAAYDRTEGFTPRSSRVGSTTGEVNQETGNTTKRTHSAHLHGNIGVTTATQMLTEAWEFAKLNVYQQMIDDFKDRFCVMVYC